MRNIYLLPAIALLAVASVLPAHAKEVDIHGDVDIKVTSSYAWRGEVINDEAAFQPSFTLDMAPFSFNLWGTWDMKHTTNSSGRARINATVDVTFESEGNLFTPGMVAYVYHDDYLGRAQDTFEVFFTYAMDMALLPSITVNYDFVDIKGTYVSAALRHSFPLVKDKLSLDVRTDIGWGDARYTQAKFSLPKYAKEEDRAFEPDGASMIDFTFIASLPMMFTKDFMIMPAIKYSHMLDGDIRDAHDDADIDVDSFGGSISFVTYF